MEALEPQSDGVSRLPLKALGLKPGMAMQTRRLVEGATKREAQYFGGIEGKGVMVGPLGPDSEPTELRVGDICLVRGFTGQYEYAFPSKVLQTFEQPFAYALLAFPTQVDAKLVRQSMRVKRSCPCNVTTTRPDGSAETITVSLIDISISGAMFRAETNLASIGSTLQLTLKVPVEGSPVNLTLDATVCHNNRAVYEEAFFLGLAFRGLTRNDILVLSYLTQNP